MTPVTTPSIIFSLPIPQLNPLQQSSSEPNIVVGDRFDDAVTSNITRRIKRKCSMLPLESSIDHDQLAEFMAEMKSMSSLVKTSRKDKTGK